MVILTLTALFEGITLTGRFFLGISMKKTWIKIMKHLGLKHCVHFHHVFLGAMVILIAYLNHSQFFMVLGIGIAISDILHHFILWHLVGNPEFHLLYKSTSQNNGKNKISKHLIHQVN